MTKIEYQWVELGVSGVVKMATTLTLVRIQKLLRSLLRSKLDFITWEYNQNINNIELHYDDKKGKDDFIGFISDWYEKPNCKCYNRKRLLKPKWFT